MQQDLETISELPQSSALTPVERERNKEGSFSWGAVLLKIFFDTSLHLLPLLCLTFISSLAPQFAVCLLTLTVMDPPHPTTTTTTDNVPQLRREITRFFRQKSHKACVYLQRSYATYGTRL